MEMDIDIEEHDVLDNPRIQAIFPDLSVVKAEPVDLLIDDEDSNYDDGFPDPDSETYPGLKIESVSGSNSVADPCEDYYRIKSKIILGSKPSTNTVLNSLVANDPNTSDEESSVLIERAQANLNSSGKKLRLSLQNMGSILRNSGRYCGICRTLFKTHYAYDSHRQTIHSHLQLVRNKAFKSTAKSQIIAGSSSSIIEASGPSKSDGDEEKLCDHCNAVFPNGEALVKHLYDLLIKKFNCGKCKASFNTASELKTHAKSHADFKMAKVKVKVEPDDEVKEEEESGEDVPGNRKMYRCKICMCYFLRLKNFKKHNLLYKVPNVDYSRKVSFNGKCKFCGYKYVKLELYNKHVSRSHLIHVLHGYKTSLRKTIKVEIDEQNVAFDPELIKQKVINIKTEIDEANPIKDQKIEIEIKTPKLEIANQSSMKNNVFRYKLSNYRIINNPPVPKTSIFKCSKCHLHFLTCFKAVAHWIRCTCTVATTTQRQCEICKRKFLKSDIELHQMQHEISSKFKVYLTHKKMPSRVLCKCPECDVHFDEYAFWTHISIGCDHGAKYELCRTCNLYFHAMSYNLHLKRHTEKLNREDFIIIEFVINPDDGPPSLEDRKVSVNPTNQLTQSTNYASVSEIAIANETPVVNLKRMIAPVEDDAHAFESPPKKIKVGNKIPLFYCKKCKSYIAHYQSAKTMHLRFNCLSARKQICLHCGLCFIYSTYIKHQNNDVPINTTLHDYVVYTLDGEKKIKPPLPAFPKCQSCHIHIPKSSYQKHNCAAETVVQCDICYGKFAQTIYKLHREFHYYGQPQAKVQSIKIKSEIVEKHDDPLPELLKKYQALQKFWNILYLCSVCDIATDSYDKAINHCHSHYYNNEKGVALRRCKKCNVQFESACFEKHKQYHSKTVNSNSFDILKYNYKDLALKNWLFGTLPKEQVQQIENRSIYINTRFVRMKLLGSGTTDLTVYKCMSCLMYVSPSGVVQHTRVEVCKPGAKGFLCSTCKIAFNTETARQEHQVIHSVQNVNLNSFRIVAFNHKKDKELNKLLESIDISRKHPTPTKSAAKHAKTDNDDVSSEYTGLHFYRCKKCKVCFRKKTRIHVHKCDSRLTVICKKCHLRIPVKALAYHVDHHKKIPVVLANYKITDFDPNLQYLFQCKVCASNYLTMQALIHHLSSGDHGGPTKSCPDCRYLFPEKVFDTHIDKHHVETNFKRKDLIVIHKSLKDFSLGSVYKCKYCITCYMSPITLRCHHHNKDHAEPSLTAPCETCGLIFSPIAMAKHVKIHHESMNLTAAQMRIKVLEDMREVSVIKCSEYRDIVNQHSNISVPINIAPNITPPKITTPPKAASPPKASSPPKTTRLKESTSVALVDKSSNKHDTRSVIYRCAQDCNVHYLIEKSLAYHYSVNHNYTSFPCPECKLMFTNMTMKRHLLHHHEMKKCTAKDFRVVVLDWSRGIKDVIDNDAAPKVGDIEDKSDKIDEPEAEIEVCVDEETTEETSLETPTGKRKSRQRTSLMDIKWNTPVEKTKASEKSSLFKNFLFKCIKCSVHFNCFRTVEFHFKASHTLSMEVVPCRLCDLKFTKLSINNHIENQHCPITGSLNDIVLFSIWDIDKDKDIDSSEISDEKPECDREIRFGVSTRTIYKCQRCDIHFMSLDSMLNHCYVANHRTPSREQCPKCGIIFSRRSVVSAHLTQHHTNQQLTIEQMHFITDSHLKFDKAVKLEDKPEETKPLDADECSNDTEDVLSDSESQKSQSSSLSRCSNAQIKLYKCGECNVNFVTQATCYKHVIKHVPLHPREYIACKFCNFQFRYITLQRHINIHHHDDSFDLNNVVIEEYIPNKSGGPKVNVYGATDKSPAVLSSTADSTVTSTTVDNSDGSNKDDAVATTSVDIDEQTEESIAAERKKEVKTVTKKSEEAKSLEVTEKTKSDTQSQSTDDVLTEVDAKTVKIVTDADSEVEDMDI